MDKRKEIKFFLHLYNSHPPNQKELLLMSKLGKQLKKHDSLNLNLPNKETVQELRERKGNEQVR